MATAVSVFTFLKAIVANPFPRPVSLHVQCVHTCNSHCACTFSAIFSNFSRLLLFLALGCNNTCMSSLLTYVHVHSMHYYPYGLPVDMIV